jgi:hypothetical protein
MQEIKIRRNWLPLVLWWLFAAGILALTLYTITWPAIKEAQLGQPLSGGWTWSAVNTTTILVTAGAVVFGSMPLNQLRTSFTDEGIKVPGLWGSKFMRWEDIVYVDGVSARSFNLRFTSSDQSIVINKSFYLNPNELMALVHSRLPESIHWRD